MPAPFRLHNTLSRSVEDFVPLEDGKVSLYFCGLTTYDEAHVGHARAFVTFDMVVRYLRHRGWDVSFAVNFTDIDDKIIARAKERGEDPLALSERYVQRWIEDSRALGLVEPTKMPRVTETMDEIIQMIASLVERDHAYENEGTVWFDVASFPEYGKLSGQKMSEVRSAETMPGKRSPQDFALWKAEKPGEPAWDSPWGRGRPGWHIECSVMCTAHLGPMIDIHGGGIDLVFPHHENEIAQSEAALGHGPFSRYWMHNGMLTVAAGSKVGGRAQRETSDDAGEKKMGKSEGNAFNVGKALTLFPAEAFRIFYLQVHYRSPLPWSLDALPDALALLARLYEAMEVAGQMQGEGDPKKIAKELGADALRALELAEEFEARFYAAMDDDFNTAKALGYAFELARAVNRFANHKKAKSRGGPIAARALEAFSVVADGLGLLQLEPDAFFDEVKAKRLPTLGLTVAGVDERLAARSQARADKDWARADAIRAELEAAGIQVMDRPDRVDWRVRLDVREEA